MASIFSLLHRFNLVKRIPIFSKLSWLELRRIARFAIIEEYRKGEFIRRQSDPADYFYYLISGRVHAFAINYRGDKENEEFIHLGMPFGIISAFTGENHTLNFEVLNDAVILKIERKQFLEILKSVPQLGIEFSHSLSKRVRSHVQGEHSLLESKIISIYSPVKDTGSSTYASNLALSLQKETRRKVILVKILTLQNQFEQTDFPSREEKVSVRPSMINLKDVSGDQAKVFENIISNVLTIDVLNVVFDSREAGLKRMISPLLSALIGEYRYMIVDLPNDMDDFVLETLTQSDNVHLVTWDTQKDLEATRNVIDRLQLTFKERFSEEKIRVILRSADKESYLSYEDINKAIDFNVYTMIPNLQITDMIKEVHDRGIVFYRCHDQSKYYQVITRIARQVGGVMVGVVLGGGAALGVAHIGVIRVLEEEGIPVDIVVGSSMGALIGSMWAIGKDSKALEEIASEFKKKISMRKLIDPVFPISGLIAGRAITRWLRKHLGDSSFYDCRFPLKIVSYDLIHREEIVIEDGSLVDAVRRSISIPGVIEPIKNNHQIIIDGGVLNPLPTNVLVQRGIKKIIAINVLQSPEQTSQGFDMVQNTMKEEDKVIFFENPVRYIGIRLSHLISRMFYANISDIIVRTLQATEYVIAVQSAKQANVVIHPNLVGINWFELDKVDELINRGMEATRQNISQIKKMVESN